jgi:hypothetical protein
MKANIINIIGFSRAEKTRELSHTKDAHYKLISQQKCLSKKAMRLTYLKC